MGLVRMMGNRSEDPPHPAAPPTHDEELMFGTGLGYKREGSRTLPEITLPSINDSLQSIPYKDHNDLLPAIDHNQEEDETKKHGYQSFSKLDSPMSDILGDELYKPSSRLPVSAPSSTIPQEVLSQRLQDANRRYPETPKSGQPPPSRVGTLLGLLNWNLTVQKAANPSGSTVHTSWTAGPYRMDSRAPTGNDARTQGPFYSLSTQEQDEDKSEEDPRNPIILQQTFLDDTNPAKYSSDINTGNLHLESFYSEFLAALEPEPASPYLSSSSNPQVASGIYHEVQNVPLPASDPDVDMRLPKMYSPNNEQSFNSMGPTKPNVVVLKKQLYQEGSLTEEQTLRIRELGTAILQAEPDSQERNVLETVAGGVGSQYYDTMKLPQAVRRLDPFGNPNDSQRTWRVDDPSPAASKSRSRENKRKVLRVLIKGKEHLSCPDSGASENIMSEEFASHEGFHIRPRVKMFQLGNGKYVWSTCKVYTSVIVPGLPLSRRKQAFFVLPDCPVALIMGLPFLEEAEIMSKNRHVLESCPVELKNISHLLWIGPPRNRMKCSFAGRDLIGVADTGSDLNMMSLECAKREGFDIDQRDSARRRIRFGDGSEAETVGQVYVYNLGFDWSQPETETQDTSPSNSKDSPSNDAPSGVSKEDNYDAFHVFPGLPSDLVFGRDLLERLDAFNLCHDLVSEHPKKRKRPDEEPVSEFNILINVRRSIFSFRKRRKNNAGSSISLDEREKHNDDWHAELGRRSREEDRIRSLPQREQGRARRAERRQVTEWDQLHALCLHCHPE